MAEKYDRANKLRNREFQIQSPNKENLFGSANQLFSPLSPLSNHNMLANYNSPTKTISIDALEFLKSNKSKEVLKDDLK
jgi:hypothetical protein